MNKLFNLENPAFKLIVTEALIVTVVNMRAFLFLSEVENQASFVFRCTRKKKHTHTRLTEIL